MSGIYSVIKEVPQNLPVSSSMSRKVVKKMAIRTGEMAQWLAGYQHWLLLHRAWI